MPGAIVVANDITDPEAADVLAEMVRAKLGGLDGAFLNAGLGRFAPLSEVRWFDRKKLPTRNRSFVRIPALFHHEGHEGHEGHEEHQEN